MQLNSNSIKNSGEIKKQIYNSLFKNNIVSQQPNTPLFYTICLALHLDLTIFHTICNPFVLQNRASTYQAANVI